MVFSHYYNENNKLFVLFIIFLHILYRWMNYVDEWKHCQSEELIQIFGGFYNAVAIRIYQWTLHFDEQEKKQQILALGFSGIKFAIKDIALTKKKIWWWKGYLRYYHWIKNSKISLNLIDSKKQSWINFNSKQIQFLLFEVSRYSGEICIQQKSFDFNKRQNKRNSLLNSLVEEKKAKKKVRTQSQ